MMWEGLHSPFLFLALIASTLEENLLSVKIRAFCDRSSLTLHEESQ